jgi:hypothetical protein
VTAVGVFASGGQASAATTLGEVFTPTNFEGVEMFIQSASPASNYAAPADGVITNWSFQAGSDLAPPMKLKMMRAAGGLNYTVVGASRLESPALSTVNTWATRIPVKAGDFLGVYYSGSTRGSRNAAGFQTRAGVGDPSPGSTNSYGYGSAAQIDLAARLEADADGDGYGDETQDGCPTNASTQGACPAANLPATPTPTPTPTPPAVVTPPDTTRPVLGALSMSSSVFQAAGSGPAFTARVGTKVSFTLSEPGSVKFTVQRKTRGRRVAGRCRPQTTANRTKPACTRWVNVRGSFTVAAKKGANKFTFRGRIGGRKLKPATYRLNGRATDKAGNKSALKRKSFRIVR